MVFDTSVVGDRRLLLGKKIKRIGNGRPIFREPSGRRKNDTQLTSTAVFTYVSIYNKTIKTERINWDNSTL